MVGIKARKEPSGPSSNNSPTTATRVDHQQPLLDVFSSVFSDVISSNAFPSLLRDIKRALFDRDFAAAFSDERRLEAYAARWSPPRALCYAATLVELTPRLQELLCGDDGDEDKDTVDTLRLLCVGGGAAELAAAAAYLRDNPSRVALTLVDAAPWSHVVDLVHQRLCVAPTLSKYASAAAVAANAPFICGSRLSVDHCRHDVLSLSHHSLTELVGSHPLLVTLLFTLNEMYAQGGLAKTTAFLRSLGEALPSSSLLLVMDSPGSYSEAAVGKDKRRYPMQWLLDHTLLDNETQGRRWEKLESRDSLWFRLPEALTYPIQLEDMRYQMHLYQLFKC
ncbi:25S rRNA (uridine(2843)-N(3))-methyltransferase [Ophiocordyceps camponoti-floridani]|uniref:25S rRNA (Uridine(2843)-N(3))-methyltransferase n=1 Tax=Ophiocordyceps camponoti-floridani TaxID=2030778 RepID=A0A8H4QCP9_9HYPO|nr:25S rRNA (uridine(2843)-N(3))-methyltransferase [Ophiocordyceps camponoti-floridani]